MKTIWQQIAEKTAIECYNAAVDAEICNPSEPSKAFRRYYAAALLGNRDAAFHVVLAFDIVNGVEQSKRLAKFGIKFSDSNVRRTV